MAIKVRVLAAVTRGPEDAVVNRDPVALRCRSEVLRPPTLQTLPAAVTANVAEIRARARSTIMAVVKADGYGHGAVTVAKAAVAGGAGWLGTTSVAEAFALRAAGLGSPLAHLAATSATLTDPAAHFGMVRVGAGLVGIDPSGTVEMHGASRLSAPIVHTTAVPAGTPVGYDGTYVTGRATHLSVLPVGYADGIPRELSARAGVEIRGRRHPVAGRVSMDQIVIDTGAESFPAGTSATVFGPDGGAVPTVHDWARWAGTIPHAIVAGIGPRVRRSIG